MIFNTIEKPASNRRLVKKRVQWLNAALCFYQSLGLFDSESLRDRRD